MTAFKNFLTSQSVRPPAPPPPKPTFLQKAGNFATGVGKAIASPFARVGVEGYNLGAAGVKTAQGNIPGAQAELGKSRNLPILGQTKPTLTNPQKPGVNDLLDVAGQGVQLGADAIGGEGFGSGVMNGIKTGATIGATQGFGNALTQTEGKSVGQNLGNIAGQTAIGGVTGGVIGGATNAIHPIFSRSTPIMNPEDTLGSRIADATPSFSKEMQGQNIKSPTGEITPRANEGEGLMGKRTVNTSAAEAEQGKTLAGIQDYPDNGTAMQKEQAVGRAVSSEAENMRGGLQTEDKTNPLDIKIEKAKIEDLVKSNLPADIQEKIGYAGKNSPLSGAKELPQTELNKQYQAMAAGSPEENLPKTKAGRYYQKVLENLQNYDGTREGKLNLQQANDKAYEAAAGKLAWGGPEQSALDEVNTNIRNSIKQDLADTTKNSDTLASLKKQTNLYRAKDTLVAKAKAEAPSEIGRFFQKHPILQRLATREFMRTATSIGTSAAGIGILTKYITDTLKGK